MSMRIVSLYKNFAKLAIILVTCYNPLFFLKSMNGWIVRQNIIRNFAGKFF